MHEGALQQAMPTSSIFEGGQVQAGTEPHSAQLPGHTSHHRGGGIAIAHSTSHKDDTTMPSHHRTPQPDPKYNNQQRVAYSLQHSQELTSSAVSHPQNLHAVHLPNINDHGFSGNLLNPQMRESRNPSGGDYMNSATKASLPTPKSHKS